MTTRSVSPGAALLRSSRMFSIPAPLSLPPSASTLRTASPSATKEYPTKLTLTTTYAARMNGDWGLKRSFPTKTTTKQTLPLIRINQLDTIEHVTDFDTAADHTVTLYKFQEMNLPMSVPPKGREDTYDRYRFPKSVFEEDIDITAVEPGKEKETEHKRWRFKGPWLAGMTEGEFKEYLEKTVRERRPEFRSFLKTQLAAEMTRDIQASAREAGLESIPNPILPESITNEQFMEYQRKLRFDRIELYRLVSRFLDLAPVSIENEMANIPGIQPGVSHQFNQTSPYSSNGPPRTHPSAGISYLRTRSFQDNHPIYGPQRSHPPIKSRILKPRAASAGQFRPTIGTGGFVATTAEGDTTMNAANSAKEEDRGLYELDLETRGGAKKYYGVRSANITSTGLVVIAVEDPNPEARVVEKERVGEENAWRHHKMGTDVGQVARNPRRFFRPMGNSQSYGLGRERSL